jgi:hypothetical protein
VPFTSGSSRELAGYVWHAPIATDFCGAAKYRDVPHKRTYAPQYRLVVFQNRVRRDGSLIAAVFFGLALCGPGHFDGLRSTSMVL